MTARVWLLAVMLTIGARAYADPDEQRPNTGYIGKDVLTLEVDECRPADPMSNDQLRAIGHEHYSRGEVLYLQGDYKGAVDELVASYCLVPFYTILKDIGQAYERELEYSKALAYFERYVLAVPADAKPAGPCAPDPQDDKRVVKARIEVLRHLRSQVLVGVVPDDAEITLAHNGIVEAAGHSGQPLEVVGGPYVMKIQRDGFHTVEREIHVDVGKPYTLSEKLEPRTGKLKIRVIPGDAKLVLDEKQVGEGDVDLELPRGKYTLEADAEGRQHATRQIEVFADQDTTLTFELPLAPQAGRAQLLVYSGLGGALAGGTLGAASSSNAYILGGAAAGAIGGLAATYYGTHEVPLGQSSLAITSSLIGGVVGGSLGYVGSGRDEVVAPFVGGGLLLGAAAGYYLGDKLEVRPGDAAIINSGALWGTALAGFFDGSFSPGPRIGGGIVLSGVAMGTIAAVMVDRNFSVSRGRAVLIDVSGAIGLFVGIAAASVATSVEGTTLSNDVQNERNSNFAIGGIVAGLVLGGVLTRNMDEPKLAVQPVVGQATTAGGRATTTIGFGAAF